MAKFNSQWWEEWKSGERAAKDVERHGRQSWGKKVKDTVDSGYLSDPAPPRSYGKPGSGGQREASAWRETEWDRARYDYLRKNRSYLRQDELDELNRIQEDRARVKAQQMRDAQVRRSRKDKEFLRETRRQARADRRAERDARREAERDMRDEHQEGMRDANDRYHRGDPPPGYRSW